VDLGRRAGPRFRARRDRRPWIELVAEEIGPLPREEKPWIRDLAGQIVSFCRRADRSADVLFVWSLR